jgi:hypothetical protein
VDICTLRVIHECSKEAQHHLRICHQNVRALEKCMCVIEKFGIKLGQVCREADYRCHYQPDIIDGPH